MTSTIALFAIARPTFDVPLAQSEATTALNSLEEAGHNVVGTRDQLLMDADGAQMAVGALDGLAADLVVLLQASFADSSMAVQIAQAAETTGAPLLLWAVPEERSGGRLRLNSFCGMNLAGHALTQHAIRYDYLLQPADDALALAAITQLARAGHARQVLRSTRIGVVGERPGGFETCDYDPDHLRTFFGAEVIPLALEETLAAAAVAPTDERAQFVARAAAYAANLSELDDDALAGTVGVYSALRGAAKREKLGGVAVRCWPEFFTELGCAACGAMSMLNEDRCPASCEADVNGTLTSILLQALTDDHAFIADLVSLDPADDTGVLWHCGLAPVSMADPDAEILGALHSNRKLPLLFEFPLKPGRVTLARLHRRGREQGLDDYELVIGGGEIVRAPKSFGGTSGVIHFDSPANDVLDVIMCHGLEHHVSLVYGDVRAELRAFAELVGLPVLALTASS